MPFQVLVNTNPLAPALTVQFLDASGHVVNTPAGAQVEFDSDNPGVVVTPDPNNALKGNIALPTTPIFESADVTVKVTGVNDVNNQPYSDHKIQAQIFPPIPAAPAAIQFRVEQVAP